MTMFVIITTLKFVSFRGVHFFYSQAINSYAFGESIDLIKLCVLQNLIND